KRRRTRPRPLVVETDRNVILPVRAARKILEDRALVLVTRRRPARFGPARCDEVIEHKEKDRSSDRRDPALETLAGVDTQRLGDPAPEHRAPDTQNHGPEPVHRISARVEKSRDRAGDQTEDGISNQPHGWFSWIGKCPSPASISDHKNGSGV